MTPKPDERWLDRFQQLLAFIYRIQTNDSFRSRFRSSEGAHFQGGAGMYPQRLNGKVSCRRLAVASFTVARFAPRTLPSPSHLCHRLPSRTEEENFEKSLATLLAENMRLASEIPPPSQRERDSRSLLGALGSAASVKSPCPSPHTSGGTCTYTCAHIAYVGREGERKREERERETCVCVYMQFLCMLCVCVGLPVC